MAHSITWFDIPVADLERATAFYRGVTQMHIDHYGGDVPVAVFGHGPGDVAGCLFTGENAQPSDHGPLLYFPVEGRLQDAADAVEGLGGKVLEPPHGIPPHGHRAVILDSEGNRIALHSET